MKHLFLTTIFVFFSIISLFAQKEKPREQAQRLFDNGFYERAMPILLQYTQEKPKDWDAKYMIGVCFFKLGQAPRAEQFLQNLIKENAKPPIMTHYYLAKALHYQQKYTDAVKYYKMALATIKTEDAFRQSIKDDIQRCQKGNKIQFAEQLAYVDNLGDTINKVTDEYAPIVATNNKNEDVLLFSAVRAQNVGEFTDIKGVIDANYGNKSSDIFITEQTKGEWLSPDSFGEPYNSNKNDQILDLSADGVFVYLARANGADPSDIYYAPYFDSDSTNNGIKEPAKAMPAPINSPAWDGDSYFFKDSVLLFSSARPGGYGGKDLYISTRGTNGDWAAPLNLGPVVNTPFDETAPFLSTDGRDLYYSSNNLTSIGGLDIFQTHFIDSLKAFTTPENMGLPINSPADDQYFRITKDGNRAYFSSDRMGGRGGQDIYVAYFKTVVAAQKKVNNPASFVELLAAQIRKNGVDGAPIIKETAVDVKNEKPKYLSQQVKISPIFYNETTISLVPSNVNLLNNLVELGKMFPKLKFEFTAHSDDNGIRNFALYFAAKRVQEVSEFLVQKGITPDRILLRSVGMSYPIAKNIGADNQPNDIGRNLNRRIEIRILNAEGTPLQLEDVRPKMSEQLVAEEGGIYRKSIENQLKYKIQVKLTRSMLDTEFLTTAKDAMVETSHNSGTYRYTVGLYDAFAKAKTALDKIKADDPKMSDAFIVGFLNGQRVAQEQIPELLETYPDLKNLIKE
jgi:outer membrane protein OmpA-like peptidoglycan-associated protein/tetratricopeptide (TPR) repeat protein